MAFRGLLLRNLLGRIEGQQSFMNKFLLSRNVRTATVPVPGTTLQNGVKVILSNSGICSGQGQPLLNNQIPLRQFHLLRQITPELKNLFSERNGSPLVESSRSLIKFSFKGKRKSVKAVIRRFYRLEWGAWIRPRSGRHNKLWKKGSKQRKRARTHVFVNSTRSYMLDKMVTKFWHRKKYYVDDPYESYNTRPTFWITHRR